MKRFLQESFYGIKILRQLLISKPDLIISSNTPREAQKVIQIYSKIKKIPFIFWLQDIRSIAVKHILRKKSKLISSIIGFYYYILEKNILLASSHIVTISNDFNKILTGWGIVSNKITTIPNWATINDIPLHSKVNEFSVKHNIHNKFVVLYSGTLAMKHNPDLIYEVAFHFRQNDKILFMVITEGIGADFLKAKIEMSGINNLKILPFQPYKIIPLVLGSADVLLTILEESAGSYSVPSKLWSYYCAGRANIISAPENNLTVKITRLFDTGIVVESNDLKDLIYSIEKLYTNQDLRERYANNSRKYAENNFKISEISRKFDIIFKQFID